MKAPVEIIICLGSSCFSRGNKNTLQAVKEYIVRHKLENDVIFKGNHCFAKCVDGPVMKINGKIHYHITKEKAIELLKSYISND